MECEPRNDTVGETMPPAPASPGAACANSTLWRRTKLLALSLMGVCGLAAVIYFLRPIGVTGQPGSKYSDTLEVREPKDVKDADPLGAWKVNPDLAIVVSGQTHGYLKPCGCSKPQLGGVPRRYNFIKSLRNKGWPVVALDVGELAEDHGPQAMLKYEFLMKSLREMNYSAVGLGKTEFNSPFVDALGRFALNNPAPPAPAVIATNLADPQGNFQQMNVHKFVIINSQPKLGVYSIVDSKIEKEISDKDCKFESAAASLVPHLLANRAAVSIVLYQGTDAKEEVGKFLDNLALIRKKNPAVPQVYMVFCLTPGSEPPANAVVHGQTTIVSVGWKGRYVGVIGLFRNGAGFQLKYQLVQMDPRWETPDAQIAGHPVVNLLEEYSRKVQAGNFIAKFPRDPHPVQVALKGQGIQTEYAGSHACFECHKEAFKKWQASHHSHAFKDLENAKHPGLQQFNGECVKCHTVGFQHHTGYLAPGTSDLTESLKNVGCESCHGPASAHVRKPRNEDIRKEINPLSTRRRINMDPKTGKPNAFELAQKLRRQDDFCQKCHDQENDVNYGKRPFPEIWKLIEHNELPVQGAAQPIKIEPMPPRVGPAPPGGISVTPAPK